MQTIRQPTDRKRPRLRRPQAGRLVCPSSEGRYALTVRHRPLRLRGSGANRSSAGGTRAQNLAPGIPRRSLVYHQQTEREDWCSFSRRWRLASSWCKQERAENASSGRRSLRCIKQKSRHDVCRDLLGAGDSW